MAVWSQKGDAVLHTLKGGEGSVTALAFHPNGRILASGDAAGAVRIWDVATGEQQKPSVPMQPAQVMYVAYAPDGKTVLAGSADGLLRLYEAESGRELLRLPSRGRLAAAVFSPDGEAVAAGSAALVLDGVKTDGEIRIWHVGHVLKAK